MQNDIIKIEEIILKMVKVLCLMNMTWIKNILC